ncbi:hypothetical protein C8N43_2333 [Litoreibacter ponti]|uniref:Dihydrodipicolinate reductase n=1 Tax=Litoreibacter ponti TaxID=1510457 RepID=A0A2T6BNN7_9RHOB|nr:dihydrodipicolinate reductase [Litoreibacter ponti]PTX57662.1 hypothetical protein C8N43_2333 [Litoreibacter ponti]
MSFYRSACIAAAIALPASATAASEGFEKISTKSQFMQVVKGKDLTMLGISVNVSSDGDIGGKAYGRKVDGKWNWKDGYFCRDLFWGEMDLGPNCQEVRVNGDVIRFQSDRGTGRYADLRMR